MVQFRFGQRLIVAGALVLLLLLAGLLPTARHSFAAATVTIDPTVLFKGIQSERTRYITLNSAASMQGIFYNRGAHAGGLVDMNIALQPIGASGYINFTNRQEDPTPLCGAGNFSGAGTNDNLSLTFISADPDQGCGFDKNAVFTITSTIDTSMTHSWGDYASKNANGSNIAEYPGVLETWTSSNRPIRISYTGVFTNTAVNRGGPVTIDIAIGTNTVSGYMNFTNNPSEGLLCGAGEFTGVKDGSTLEYSFISHDLDPGCGFDTGLRFVMQASLSENATVIAGNYNIGQSGGIFRATTAVTDHAIFGRVADANNNSIPRTIISVDGKFATVTGSDGTYMLLGLPGGTYTITPFKSGYTFNPPSLPVAVPPSMTGKNFTGTANAGGFRTSFLPLVVTSKFVQENITNNIWAGYVSIGLQGHPQTFTDVSASWTVNSIRCLPEQLSNSSEWVGLGGIGVGKVDLEQIGTLSSCYGGVLSYRAVYQIIVGQPNGVQYIDETIKPGDHIRAHVHFNEYSGGQGLYLLEEQNLTQGWSFSKVLYGSAQPTAIQTAECILEDPAATSGYSWFLSNFGTFTFQHCNANNLPFSLAPRVIQITIINNFNQPKVQVAQVEPGDDQFSIKWLRP